MIDEQVDEDGNAEKPIEELYNYDYRLVSNLVK